MANWDSMDEFLAETHGRHHVLRDRELFEWFYCRNHDQPEQANLVVAYDDSLLVAILGYVPTVFLYAGEKVQGCWTALWYALPHYRHGVGALLMRRLTEIFDIVAGQGASSMNRAIVTAMGHNFIEAMPKVVLILDEASIMPWLPSYSATSIDQKPIPRDAEIARPLSRTNYSPDWAHYPDLGFSTLRDFEHLHRRYEQYPFMNYELLVVGEPRSPSVAVLRFVDTTSGVKVGRLLEFFGPDTTRFREQNAGLLDQVISLCKMQGCTYIDFYTTSLCWITFFQEYGFSRDDSGELPSLLDPVDPSRTFQNLEYFVSPTLRSKVPYGETEMYASRGDGDQDRPNAMFAAARMIGR